MAYMRTYTFAFDNVAVTAAQDLFELTAGATVSFVLLSFNVGFIGTPASQNLRIRFHRGSTSGSGGSTPTGRATDEGNTIAAATTCEANNTSQGSVGNVLRDDTFNILSGYSWVLTPEEWTVTKPTARLTVALDTAPTASTNASGSITIGEIGG